MPEADRRPTRENLGWLRVVFSFLDEKNIKWLLAVGISLVLAASAYFVHTNWQFFERYTFLQYVLVAVFTAACAGLAEALEKVAGLPRTARAFHVTSLLLVPLNFVAMWLPDIAIFSRKSAAPEIGWAIGAAAYPFLYWVLDRSFLSVLGSSSARVTGSLAAAAGLLPLAGAGGPMPAALAVVAWLAAIWGIGGVRQHYVLGRRLDDPLLMLVPAGALAGVFAVHCWAASPEGGWIGLVLAAASIPVLHTANGLGEAFGRKRRRGGSVDAPRVLGLLAHLVMLAGTAAAFGGRLSANAAFAGALSLQTALLAATATVHESVLARRLAIVALPIVGLALLTFSPALHSVLSDAMSRLYGVEAGPPAAAAMLFSVLLAVMPRLGGMDEGWRRDSLPVSGLLAVVSIVLVLPAERSAACGLALWSLAFWAAWLAFGVADYLCASSLAGVAAVAEGIALAGGPAAAVAVWLAVASSALSTRARRHDPNAGTPGWLLGSLSAPTPGPLAAAGGLVLAGAFAAAAAADPGSPAATLAALGVALAAGLAWCHRIVPSAAVHATGPLVLLSLRGWFACALAGPFARCGTATWQDPALVALGAGLWAAGRSMRGLAPAVFGAAGEHSDTNHPLEMSGIALVLLAVLASPWGLPGGMVAALAASAFFGRLAWLERLRPYLTLAVGSAWLAVVLAASSLGGAPWACLAILTGAWLLTAAAFRFREGILTRLSPVTPWGGALEINPLADLALAGAAGLAALAPLVALPGGPVSNAFLAVSAGLLFAAGGHYYSTDLLTAPALASSGLAAALLTASGSLPSGLPLALLAALHYAGVRTLRETSRPHHLLFGDALAACAVFETLWRPGGAVAIASLVFLAALQLRLSRAPAAGELGLLALFESCLLAGAGASRAWLAVAAANLLLELARSLPGAAAGLEASKGSGEGRGEPPSTSPEPTAPGRRPITLANAAVTLCGLAATSSGPVVSLGMLLAGGVTASIARRTPVAWAVFGTAGLWLGGFLLLGLTAPGIAPDPALFLALEGCLALAASRLLSQAPLAARVLDRATRLLAALALLGCAAETCLGFGCCDPLFRFCLRADWKLAATALACAFLWLQLSEEREDAWETVGLCAGLAAAYLSIIPLLGSAFAEVLLVAALALPAAMAAFRDPGRFSRYRGAITAANGVVLAAVAGHAVVGWLGGTPSEFPGWRLPAAFAASGLALLLGAGLPPKGRLAELGLSTELLAAGLALSHAGLPAPWSATAAAWLGLGLVRRTGLPAWGTLAAAAAALGLAVFRPPAELAALLVIEAVHLYWLEPFALMVASFAGSAFLATAAAFVAEYALLRAHGAAPDDFASEPYLALSGLAAAFAWSWVQRALRQSLGDARSDCAGALASLGAAVALAGSLGALPRALAFAWPCLGRLAMLLGIQLAAVAHLAPTAPRAARFMKMAPLALWGLLGLETFGTALPVLSAEALTSFWQWLVAALLLVAAGYRAAAFQARGGGRVANCVDAADAENACWLSAMAAQAVALAVVAWSAARPAALANVAPGLAASLAALAIAPSRAGQAVLWLDVALAGTVAPLAALVRSHHGNEAFVLWPWYATLLTLEAAALQRVSSSRRRTLGLIELGPARWAAGKMAALAALAAWLPTLSAFDAAVRQANDAQSALHFITVMLWAAALHAAAAAISGGRAWRHGTVLLAVAALAETVAASLGGLSVAWLLLGWALVALALAAGTPGAGERWLTSSEWAFWRTLAEGACVMFSAAAASLGMTQVRGAAAVGSVALSAATTWGLDRLVGSRLTTQIFVLLASAAALRLERELPGAPSSLPPGPMLLTRLSALSLGLAVVWDLAAHGRRRTETQEDERPGPSVFEDCSDALALVSSVLGLLAAFAAAPGCLPRALWMPHALGWPGSAVLALALARLFEAGASVRGGAGWQRPLAMLLDRPAWPALLDHAGAALAAGGLFFTESSGVPGAAAAAFAFVACFTAFVAFRRKSEVWELVSCLFWLAALCDGLYEGAAGRAMELLLAWPVLAALSLALSLGLPSVRSRFGHPSEWVIRVYSEGLFWAWAALTAGSLFLALDFWPGFIARTALAAAMAAWARRHRDAPWLGWVAGALGTLTLTSLSSWSFSGPFRTSFQTDGLFGAVLATLAFAWEVALERELLGQRVVPPELLLPLAPRLAASVGLVLCLSGFALEPVPLMIAGTTIGLAVEGVYWLRAAAKLGNETMVYLGESSLAGAFVYLRTSGVLHGSPWTGFIGVLLDFALLGASQAASRWRSPVYARPMTRTALALPFLLMAAFLHRGATPANIAMVFAAASFYTSACDRWYALRFVAAALYNVGLALVWSRLDFVSWQAYLSPAGMTLLWATEMEKSSFSGAARGKLRTLASMLIMGAPAISFITQQSVTNMVDLGIVCLAAILAGIWLRVRTFLYFGTVLLAGDLLGFAISKSIEAQLSAVWMLLAAGGAVIALAAFFEKKRAELLGRLEGLQAELATWE